MSYTKLFSEIITSTIWSEDDRTRIVWVTMLAMSNQHGEVMASVPGLAKVASVPLEATEVALDRLSSPDPYSRTSAQEGRRIEKIDGGWVLINHAKYRAKMDAEDRRIKNAERQRRYRRAKINGDSVTPDVTSCHALSRDVTKSNDIQKQIQKQKQKHTKKEDKDIPRKQRSNDRPPPFDSEKYVLEWNEIAGAYGLAKVRSMTDARRGKLRARLEDSAFAEAWPDGIRDAIALSGFARGGNDRGWKVDFSWLIANDENYLKLVEGKYTTEDDLRASKLDLPF